MKKKILKYVSGLVCLSLMLSLITPAVFADVYPNDGVYVELDAPKDGETADFAPYVHYDKAYEVSEYNEQGFINGIRYCDLRKGIFLTEDSVITYESDYKVDIMIEPKAGYGFQDYNGTPNVNAYIMSYELDGCIKRQASVQWFPYNQDKILMTYVYNVREVESIDFVSLTVEAPEQGQFPSYDYKFLTSFMDVNRNFDDGTYCINGMKWHNVDTSWDPLALGQPLGKDEVFVGGQTYRLTIQIAAEKDLANDIERKFDFDYAPVSYNNKILVNGYDTRGKHTPYAPESKVNAENYYIIYKDFYCPKKETVKEVALEVDPPILQEAPDFDVTFGGGYRAIQNPPEDGFINGIKWRDLTDGENLTEHDVFQAGHRYAFSAYLEPIDENTAFYVDNWGDTMVSGTLNGNEASVSSGMICYDDQRKNDSRVISFYYIFEAVSNEVTRVAVLNLEEPIAGEAPDYTADVKNNGLYSFDTQKDDGNVIVNSIRWSNVTDNQDMTPTDTFEAGKQYSVCAYITIADGYSMGNSLTASINTMTSQAYAILGSNNLVLCYTFDEVEPIKIASDCAMGMKSPVEGEYPYYDIALMNEGCVIQDIRWRDNSVSMDGTYITEEDAFIGGHQYQIELDIVPAENYEFMTDYEGNIACELLFEVDGVAYEGIVEGTKDEITAIYRFARLPISYVNIAIDAPSPDFAPSFYAYADSDTYYAINVTWYDKTDDVYITEEDDYVFVENHVYVVTADVFPASNGCFDAYSDRFVGTVNQKAADIGTVSYQEEGSEAVIIYSKYYGLRFSYEFAPCVQEPVFTVECDRLTGLITVAHELYSLFEEEKLVLHIAFYNHERLVSVVEKEVQFGYDIYGEPAPDDATYCKAMLWNKKTMEPICNAVGCAVVKDEF